MKKVFTALSLPIVLAASSGEQNPGPPTEFMLFANGDTATLKGTFKCGEYACARVLSAMSAAGRDKLPIDYNHGQVSFMGASYDAGRAAGWFVPANRDGQLWATEVEWTPQGAKALADREYRMFSPAFLTDDNRNVVELINVALTNLPATLRQTPLVTGEFAGNEEETMDPILLALLAKHNGDPKALAAAIEQLNTQNAQLVAASQTINVELQALKASQAATAEATAKAEKDGLIVALSADGRLPPAMHSWAQSLTIAQLKDFEAKAPKPASAPVVASAGTRSASAGAGRPSVSDPEVRKVLVQMGVSAVDFLAEDKQWVATKNRIELGIDARDTVCCPEEAAYEFDPDAPAPKKEAA
jgi:phage I-like protein